MALQRTKERTERREAKRLRKTEHVNPNKKRKYPNCPTCNRNPASAKCVHQMCKPCCHTRSVEQRLDCAQHNFKSKLKEITEKENIVKTMELDKIDGH